MLTFSTNDTQIDGTHRFHRFIFAHILFDIMVERIKSAVNKCIAKGCRSFLFVVYGNSGKNLI